jgi:hypothetical protein
MVIVSGLFTAFSRLIGAVATSTLGWATILLFGRVPQSRQRFLSLMALGSIVWLIAVFGVVLPAIGDVIVSAVPRPPLVDAGLIRWAMLLIALLLPAAMGAATMALSPEDERDGPAARLEQLLRGYPFTAVLAFTIVFLAAWAIVRNLQALRRDWESVHVPMIVKPGRYEAVVADLASALAEAGLDVERKRASRWFVVPPRLLATVAGRGVKGLVPDELVAFKGDELGILVYPSDVAVLGRKDLVARARDAIARSLTFADAYLTNGKETEQIEDRLREISRRPAVGPADFKPIDAQLTSLAVPYDEWETLLRLRLQVEHEALVGRRTSGGRTG